jgi:hypothetical protein
MPHCASASAASRCAHADFDSSFATAGGYCIANPRYTVNPPSLSRERSGRTHLEPVADRSGPSWQSEGVAFATIHETENPRAGRRFEPTHELALHDGALFACRSLPGAHQGVVVIREMVGPIGIPDLTALVGKPAVLQQRLDLPVPPLLNRLDAAIVAVAAPRLSRDLSAIAASLGWPVTTIERRVPALLDVGALRETRPGRYVRPSALQPTGRLYAIEAKVRDRSAAVQQGRSYSVWADSYVIVIGALGARPLDALMADVSADSAGLLVDGRWLSRPVIRSLGVARRMWAAEHVVAALRGRHQPSVAP